MMLVGVVYNGSALMPTTPQRARLLIASRKATPFIHKGVFCIRLNQAPSDNKFQPVSIGVDPGSKKEGISIVTEKKTVLNIQLDAVTWVKEVVETRRNVRNARRFRKTPCRAPRFKNRNKSGWIPPSTKARWQSKLNLIKSLKQIFPISICVIEDICAVSKEGQTKWNKSFSPLEVGKTWFYKELESTGLTVLLMKGYETKSLREQHQLHKSSQKLSNKWDAHCVDSWVLAASTMQTLPLINKSMMLMKPIQFHRRQLHVMQPTKGDVRRLYGSTRSLGFRRGSIVKHSKYGICTIGGTSNNRISLHGLETGIRVSRNIKVTDVTMITYNKHYMEYK